MASATSGMFKVARIEQQTIEHATVEAEQQIYHQSCSSRACETVDKTSAKSEPYILSRSSAVTSNRKT